MTRYRRGAIVIAVSVVSHWVRDAISHRPDMPLVQGGELRIGLDLWKSPTATVIVETVTFAAGVWLYTARSRSEMRAAAASNTAAAFTSIRCKPGCGNSTALRVRVLFIRKCNRTTRLDSRLG